MFNMFVSGFCFAMVVINVSLMVVTDGKFDGVSRTIILILLGILNFIFGYNTYKRKFENA